MFEETVCDKCSEPILTDEANVGPEGEWEDATLCNECYAEIRLEATDA